MLEDNVVYVDRVSLSALRPGFRHWVLLALFMPGRSPSQHQVVRLIEFNG